jgi:hypothetical protein
MSTEVLTAVNLFGGLLLLLASVVLSGLLDSETGLGASGVEIAVVVHSLLERVTFPTEDVVAVCSRATRSSQLALCCVVRGGAFS